MSTDAETIPGTVPPKPTCVADLDVLVHAKGHHRHTAHIPDPHTDDPAPFCAQGDWYHGAKWETKPPTAFSTEPDAWLTLCERCLTAIDRASDATGGDCER